MVELIASCLKKVAELGDENDVINRKNDELEQDNDKLKEENKTFCLQLEQLRHRINYLLNKQFGGKKNEGIDPNQLELLLGQLEDLQKHTEKPTEDAEPEVKPPLEKPASKPRTRYKLPEHLEEITEYIDPPEVLANPEAYKEISQDVTELLDIIPEKLIKRTIIRRKYVRIDNRDEAPIQASMPNRAIDRGGVSERFLAYMLLLKYVMHIPLYRQERNYYERFGVRVKRKDMVRWVELVAEWLKPIYNLIKQRIIQSGYIQADETPIRYLDPDYCPGKSQLGYLIWAKP